MFLAEGFAGSSVDAIAAAAGVSKQTIYNHFGDKEGLFRAVVRAVQGNFAGDFHEAGLEECLAASDDLGRDLRILGRQPAIASVQAPVLLLADPKDTLVPVDTARRLARAMPDARLQLVGGAAHHLPRRAPHGFADAIVAFLAAVEEPGNPR